MYLKELEIGNVKLKNNILLAPMAGITNLPFRLMCEKFTPGLVCTEMVSSKGIFYNDAKTNQLLATELSNKVEKRPIAMQIFGSDKEAMGYAAQIVSQKADIIDINMGCPAPKVVKNGDGSKLMLNLEYAGDIIEAVVKSSKVPVTVKMRKGWDSNNITVVELAKIAENKGAKAVTIHGRTREEYYTGTVDLEIIKKVKQALSIPVIGNGDIKTKEDAYNMFEKTGCDGIMIGRAAIGNPWIFREVQEYLSGKEVTRVTLEEKLEIMLEHIDLQTKFLKEDIAIKEMRKYMTYYLKNLPHATEMRQAINKIETKQELCDYLKSSFNNLKL